MLAASPKSGHASKAVFHFWYIVSFVCSTNMSKQCKNKQHFMFSEWAIPQGYKWCMKLSDKNTCFNLPNNA